MWGGTLFGTIFESLSRIFRLETTFVDREFVSHLHSKVSFPFPHDDLSHLVVVMEFLVVLSLDQTCLVQKILIQEDRVVNVVLVGTFLPHHSY